MSNWTTKIEMMVNNVQEQAFFLKHLKPDMNVLEYGSGLSTLAIGALVNKLVSVENNEEWFNKVHPTVKHNTTLLFAPANREPSPAYDDGTYEDFKSYVEAPLLYLDKVPKPFDVIFIDGRARVACASVCAQLGHKDTLVFIHDFNHPEEKWRRPEYFEAEKYLERIEGVFTMWKFKIKF